MRLRGVLSEDWVKSFTLTPQEYLGRSLLYGVRYPAEALRVTSSGFWDVASAPFGVPAWDPVPTSVSVRHCRTLCIRSSGLNRCGGRATRFRQPFRLASSRARYVRGAAGWDRSVSGWIGCCGSPCRFQFSTWALFSVFVTGLGFEFVAWALDALLEYICPIIASLSTLCLMCAASTLLP